MTKAKHLNPKKKHLESQRHGGSQLRKIKIRLWRRTQKFMKRMGVFSPFF